MPGPLLALLSALCSGPYCAMKANEYLAKLPAVAQMVTEGDPRLRAVHAEGETHHVEAAEDIPLLGSAFPVPQARPYSLCTFASCCSNAADYWIIPNLCAADRHYPVPEHSQ